MDMHNKGRRKVNSSHASHFLLFGAGLDLQAGVLSNPTPMDQIPIRMSQDSHPGIRNMANQMEQKHLRKNRVNMRRIKRTSRQPIQTMGPTLCQMTRWVPSCSWAYMICSIGWQQQNSINSADWQQHAGRKASTALAGNSMLANTASTASAGTRCTVFCLSLGA